MNDLQKRTWAEISLPNIRHNYEAIRAGLPAGCRFLGVVKADAYGHGALPVSRLLQEAGAEYLAVSCLDEALELRRGGIRMPVLILDTGDLDAYGLTPMSALPLLADALRCGHADAFWEEDGCEAVELQISDHTLARVWFREGVPCRAELQSDGRVTVACEIENWS